MAAPGGWRRMRRGGPLFRDREEAGRLLGDELRRLDLPLPRVVLGLPRGGIPVAAEVARALDAPLEVLVVRKLGAPRQEELAIGAVASGGLRYLDESIIAHVGVRDDEIERITARELRELARRDAMYRGERPFPSLEGTTAIIVDDGVATGASMLVAVRAVRLRAPRALVAAAPVMSEEAAALLARAADECVAVAVPQPFHGVGAWYEVFSQTTDDEVMQLLEQSRRPATARG